MNWYFEILWITSSTTTCIQWFSIHCWPLPEGDILMSWFSRCVSLPSFHSTFLPSSFFPKFPSFLSPSLPFFLHWSLCGWVIWRWVPVYVFPNCCPVVPTLVLRASPPSPNDVRCDLLYITKILLYTGIYFWIFL